MPITESQCSIPVRTAQQTQVTESSCSQPVRTDQRTRTTESSCLQGCPNAEVKTADGEAFLCNRLDAKVSRPDALQQIMKLLFPVQTPNVMFGCRRLEIRS
jgi:limonene-1,2-epoxide hydrolase